MDRRLSQTLLTVAVVALAVVAFLVLTQGWGPPPPPPAGPPVPQAPPDGPAPGDPDHPPEGPAPDAPTGPPDPSAHLALGNPSGATDDPADGDNFLMRKPYYALSYNNAKGTPNWVSWRLQRADVGSAPRGQFYPDLDLPTAFKHVTPRDYTGTGFDRGHMCPSGDRARTAEAAHATFAMSNIVPQAPSLNQKAWADLEAYCRGLVRRNDQTLYIVAGPVGRGGAGATGPAEAIARGKVTVPAKCWKVILAADGDPPRVGPGARLIAVVMPNDESVGHGWAKYRTSAREVEALTGYTFFDRVPAEVIGPLKAKVDDRRVTAPRPRQSED
jgi:endonuclease G